MEVAKVSAEYPNHTLAQKGLRPHNDLWAVEARSMSVFKTEIDKFLIARGIKGYGERAGEWSWKTYRD